MKRAASLTILFFAALVAGSASAQTVTVPNPEEAVSTVVEEVETAVGQATGSSGSPGSGSGGSSATSGSSGSGGSSGAGSGGTAGSPSTGDAHKCPPDRDAASSGGAGGSASPGGDGGSGGAMLASRRTKRDSGVAADPDRRGREAETGGVLAETAKAFPDGAPRESAPVTPVVVQKPEDVPLTVGLIALGLAGLAFAGIVGGVTTHVLGGRLR